MALRGPARIYFSPSRVHRPPLVAPKPGVGGSRSNKITKRTQFQNGVSHIKSSLSNFSAASALAKRTQFCPDIPRGLDRWSLAQLEGAFQGWGQLVPAQMGPSESNLIQPNPTKSHTPQTVSQSKSDQVRPLKFMKPGQNRKIDRTADAKPRFGHRTAAPWSAGGRADLPVLRSNTAEDGPVRRPPLHSQSPIFQHEASREPSCPRYLPRVFTPQSAIRAPHSKAPPPPSIPISGFATLAQFRDSMHPLLAENL